MAKKNVCVYIGRFNPFHVGHAAVLTEAVSTSDHTIVLVGSAFQAPSTKNPFSYTQRATMIDRFLKDTGTQRIAGITSIRPVRDYPYSDNAWIQAVQQTVSDVITGLGPDFADAKISLTGSDRDDSTWYLRSFPQWGLKLRPAFNLPNDADVSATSVRKVLFESDLSGEAFGTLSAKVPETTLTFLREQASAGMLDTLRAEYAFIKKYKAAWASAPYEPVFVTADAVVVQSGHVLVVERGALPGRGLWALPGGFVNQKERIRRAGIREAIEETGIRLAEGKRALEITEAMMNGSIRAKEIFDDPNRSARGRTITVAYLFRLDDTKPLPKVSGQNVPAYESNGKTIVETAKAFWLPLDVALKNSEFWFEDHHSILSTMISKMDE
jgi:bifunctional NMN adenylyltransferase/nudix hydrolase